MLLLVCAIHSSPIVDTLPLCISSTNRCGCSFYSNATPVHYHGIGSPANRQRNQVIRQLNSGVEFCITRQRHCLKKLAPGTTATSARIHAGSIATFRQTCLVHKPRQRRFSKVQLLRWHPRDHSGIIGQARTILTGRIWSIAGFL